MWARVEERARQELTRRAQGLRVPYEIVVESGLSGIPLLLDIALMEQIRRTTPDLIVMATRGRKGVSAFFLGSVTQEVVRNANRPVLCVRPAEHGVLFPYRTIRAQSPRLRAQPTQFFRLVLRVGERSAQL